MFEAETWVDMEEDGLMTGILTRSSEQAFLVQVRQGMAILALLHAETGDLTTAASVIKRAQDKGHDGLEIDAAAAALLWYGERREQAWAVFSELYKASSNSRFLLRIMSELAHGDSDSVPLELRKELVDRGSWKQSYNLAAGQSNQGRYEACRETADGALARFSDDDEARPLLADLAYGCLLGLDDFEQAAVRVKVYGSDELSLSNRLRHAAKLVNARRGAEALDVMAGIGPEVDGARSIQVAARLDTGDINGALQWSDGREDPELTYELAFALYDQGRFKEAAPLFERCCPALQDEDCDLLRELAKQEAAALVEGQGEP